MRKVQDLSSFILIGENGFIPQQLAEQLAPSGSFRNVLAHQYDDIDPAQVYIALQKILNQYPQYVKAIQTYLDIFRHHRRILISLRSLIRR
jgi:uncharacterized protein YutE (UPF0331/DUF86 family)